MIAPGTLDECITPFLGRTADNRYFGPKNGRVVCVGFPPGMGAIPRGAGAPPGT